MRVGILGGSFDPVHAGHLHLARSAQQAFGLDRVVFVPAREPPHKPGQELARDSDRVAMLAIALQGEPSWEIATLELEREGPSYTIDTVRALPEALGLSEDAQLFLLIGGDNLAGLVGWKAADELLHRVQPVVVVREGGEVEALARIREQFGEQIAARLARGLIWTSPVPISASALRADLARGEDPGQALPPGVLEYIRAHDIYAGKRLPS